ncbi:cytochrome c oxidase assembly factor 6 [Cucumis melo var. makuwa]|uniref:Cytochrome c oxidase assembly factor 6 n=1 Tax=Cucumis melo var. makuwa TaxID=1194695 RepID=A0A5D3D560_CUCMM|nr:cytochrome c oxidase assembly factor 6 [Cucumis melo var. makuwa]
MAIEAVSSGGFDEVHADFLSKSRQACYKVKYFDRKFCQNSRVHRLLDDKDLRRDRLILLQPYTFKPIN